VEDMMQRQAGEIMPFLRVDILTNLFSPVMILEILKMFALVVLQNASFTLVSRARNSPSILYHTMASVVSNGIWLLVIRQVVINLNNFTLMITYLIAAVIGSVSMHYVAMKWLEKPKSN
jgi:hypothetical protein